MAPINVQITGNNCGCVKSKHEVSIGRINLEEVISLNAHISNHNFGYVCARYNALIYGNNCGTVECGNNATLGSYNRGKVIAVSITYCGVLLNRKLLSEMLPGERTVYGDLVLKRNQDHWIIKSESGNSNQIKFFDETRIQMEYIEPDEKITVTIETKDGDHITNMGSYVTHISAETLYLRYDETGNSL